MTTSACAGDLERDGLAVDHLDPLALDEAGEEILVDVPGQRRRGGVRDRGRRAERDGDGQLLTALGRDLVVVTAVLVDLPVHPDGALVMTLEPVEPEVPDPRLGVLGVGEAQVEEGAAVLGPGEERGQLLQVHVVAGEDDLLDGRAVGLHLLRRQVRHRAELPEGLADPDEALRQLRLEQAADPVADLGVGLQPECLEQPPVGPEDVHGQGHGRPLDVLEQQGGPARLVHPVDDLADLQIRVDLGLDALEVTLSLQSPEQGAKIVVSHTGQYRTPATLGPSPGAVHAPRHLTSGDLPRCSGP